MKRLGTLGLLMMALLVLAGCGASPANQLAEGNEAYTAGDYDTAVQNYQPRQNGITFFKEVVLFIP